MRDDVLVIVDVQNDFVNGALGTREAEEVLPSILEKVRDFTGRVIATRDTHSDDYLETQEGERLPVVHCLKGSEGWGFPDELDSLIREREAAIYEKSTFGSPALARDLRDFFDRGEIRSVEIIGICTDICVVSNALLIKAESPELPLTVDARCCAGVTPEKHGAALDVLESCQVEVVR